jgi:predicted dehydrogenase
MSKQTRRDFLEQSLFTAAAAALAGSSGMIRADESSKKSKNANDRFQVACVGVKGRGAEHISGFSQLSDCEVTAIVDVDEVYGNRRVEQIKNRTGKAPKYYRDIRKMLDDKSIDLVSIATPNHWHALAAIWAVQAGKDVYVEKPVSHNVSEGRRIVQAARKHGRIVQSGMQSRSLSGAQQAIAYVRSGKIGEVKLARGLCYKRRDSIGPKGNYPLPATVDYNLWTGPAPMKPLTRKNLHYDWHWMWDYGNGDLGNQGIHQMDVCRWGLGLDGMGTSVLSYGGRLGYEDAGQTANTQVSIHEYSEGKRIVFEVRGLPTPPLRELQVGVIFHGTDGDVLVGLHKDYDKGAAFDPKGNVVKSFRGFGSHFKNFVKAVRSRKHADLNADILEGHYSSALCHLANLSYRVGDLVTGKEATERLESDKETSETFERFREHLAANMVMIEHAKALRLGKKLTIDPQHEIFTGPAASEANVLLTRDYRKPFVVPAEKDV